MIDIYDDQDFEEEEKEEQPQKRDFLGIMFNCCNVYSRIYKNKEGTAYEGVCPRCFKRVSVKIGKGGSDRRFFNAYWRFS